MNKVLLLGRIVTQPEVRYTTEKDIPYLKFVIAVNRDYIKSNGERDVDFVRVVVWGKRSNSLVDSLTKGRLINVIGQLSTGSYEDEGRKVYYADVRADQINFLDFKKEKEEIV